jgi:hypothetical protein
MDSPPPHVGSWDPSTKRGSQAATDAAAAEALQQQLLAGYGDEAALLEGGALESGLPAALLAGYPARLAGLLLEAAGRLGVPLGSALEVGSGVGATSLQLAAGGFLSVLGVEHDVRAVTVATAAAQTGSVSVARKVRDVVQCCCFCWGAVNSLMKRPVAYAADTPSCVDSSLDNHSLPPLPHFPACLPACRTRATCAPPCSWPPPAAPPPAPGWPSATWTPAASLQTSAPTTLCCSAGCWSGYPAPRAPWVSGTAW